MRFNTIFYCIGQGLKNIRRHLLFTLASVATITACVFLFSVVYCVLVNLRYTMETVEETVGITVFFDKGLSEEEIQNIGDQIGEREEVREMNYISGDEAWQIFSEDYLRGAEELAEGFAEDNPLADMASYEIFLNNVEDQAEFVSWLQQVPGVRRVNASSIAAGGMIDLNNAVGYVSIGLIGILLCVSVFLIHNAISMAISARRDEIRIMRLVGATKSFIRTPFLVEGLFIGLLGAAIPLGLIFFLYGRVIGYMASNMSVLFGFLSFLPIQEIMKVLLPVAAALGVGIGLLGSATSVRRHLKV